MLLSLQTLLSLDAMQIRCWFTLSFKVSWANSAVTARDLKQQFPSVLDRAYSQQQHSRGVSEIMSRNIISTAPGTTMQEAAMIMGDKHVGSLIVIEYRTPVGIVTESDLMRKVLAVGKDPRSVTVEQEMSYPLMTLSATASIREAAQTMIEKKGRLAVFDSGNLIGIVTASDLVRSLPESPETNTQVDRFMTRDLTTVSEKITVSDVAILMDVKRIGSVIVKDRDEPIGIFTERDLLTTLLAKGAALNVPVGTRASPLITISSGTSVHDAARTMQSRHIRRLPVTKDGVLVGIVTARDLVEAYAKLVT
jgi:CBS domain-containing protein